MIRFSYQKGDFCLSGEDAIVELVSEDSSGRSAESVTITEFKTGIMHDIVKEKFSARILKQVLKAAAGPNAETWHNGKYRLRVIPARISWGTVDTRGGTGTSVTLDEFQLDGDHKFLKEIFDADTLELIRNEIEKLKCDVKAECPCCGNFRDFDTDTDVEGNAGTRWDSESFHSLEVAIYFGYREETILQCPVCSTCFYYHRWTPGGSYDAMRTVQLEKFRRLTLLEASEHAKGMAAESADVSRRSGFFIEEDKIVQRQVQKFLNRIALVPKTNKA